MTNRRHRPRTPEERWTSSRAGSRAGRGFHYQDEAATHIAIECWQGRLPFGRVIPEGINDISLEGPGGETHSQVKSRRALRGLFRVSEIRDGVDSLVEGLVTAPASIGVLFLERGIEGLPATGWTQTAADFPALADAVTKLLLTAPNALPVETILRRLRIVIGGALAQDDQLTIAKALGILPGAAVFPYLALRNRLADCGDANYAATPENAASVTLTDIEATLREAVAFVDVAGLTQALAEGVLEPIDLATALDDDQFYEGVDARPGHVAAGLVVQRDVLLEEIEEALRLRSPTLVVGPSGAGKSALVWSAVARQRAERIWYRVKHLAPHDVQAVVRFVRATTHGERAAIGLAVDDLGNGRFDGWDLLVEELSYINSPAVLLAGIREEDLVLIASAPRSSHVRPVLDENLARELYAQLRAQGRTHWEGWREPFERSSGLLLEYAHLLTAGQRLSATIAEQVGRRRREGRSLELEVLRFVTTAAAYGASVSGETLRSLTGESDSALQQAMVRLIREHLVAETSSLRFGGTHILRSRAIAQCLHEPPPPTISETVATLLSVLPGPDLELIVRRVLSEEAVDDQVVLIALMSRIEARPDASVFEAALVALSGVSSRRMAESWLRLLRESGIPAPRWQLLLMSAVIRDPFPTLTDAERTVVSRLISVPSIDLRAALIDQLPEDTVARFLSSAGTHDGALAFVRTLPAESVPLGRLLDSCARLLSEGPIDARAELLSALYYSGTGVDEARIRVQDFSAMLLDHIAATRPFTGAIRVEDREEGRVVVGEHVAVAPTAQRPPETELISLCRLLQKAAPDAVAVHARVVDATGGLASELLEKQIPHVNLPAATQVDWNRRLMGEFARITAGETWTQRVTSETVLLTQLARLMPSYLRDWLRGMRLPRRQRDELLRLSELASSLPPSPLDEADAIPSVAFGAGGDATAAEDGPKHDWVQGLLVGLIRMAQRLRSEERPAPIAAYLHDTLLPGLRRLDKSTRWRFAAESPQRSVQQLEGLLTDLYAVLCGRQLPGIASSRLGTELSIAARTSELRAVQILDGSVQHAQRALADAGFATRVVTRPRSKATANDWPNVDVAAFIEMPTVFAWIGPPPIVLDALRTLADSHRGVLTIPMRQGRGVAAQTGRLIISWHLDPQAADDWRTEAPFLEDAVSGPFRDAIDALIETSAIVALARAGQLKDAEEAALEAAVGRFDEARARLVRSIPDNPPSLVLEAMSSLEKLRIRVAEDTTAAEAGDLKESAAAEILRALRGSSSSDLASQIVGFCLALVEFDVDPDQAEDRALAGLTALANQGGPDRGLEEP